MDRLSSIIKKFFPFWLFLTFFKFGGGLHYTLLAPLGEKLFPIWIVGIMVGLGDLIQLVLDVPAGRLLDRYGYKRLLVITTFIFGVASALFVFGLSKTAFIMSLATSAFGWLFFGPGVTAYVAGYASDKNIGRLTSAGHVFESAGIVLASALVPFVVLFDAKVLGLILCFIFAVAFILILLSPKDALQKPELVEPHHRRDRMKKNVLRQAWGAIVRLRPASILIMTAGLSASTFYAIIWFVVPLLIAHQAHNGLLGIGLGIFDFSVVALGFFLGKLVDAYDKKMLVGLGLFIFAIAAIFLGFNFGLLFLFLGFIATTGDELSSLSLWAWLYKIDKEHRNYGLISGTISLFEDIGWTIGPMIAGLLYTAIGPTWTIAAGGLLIFCNLIIFLFLAKHPLPAETSSLALIKPHRRRHKH